MRWAMFLLFAVVVTTKNVLGADIASGNSCNIYVRSDQGIPDMFRALLREHGDEAAEICTAVSGRVVVYNPTSEVLRGHFGVCTFEVLSYSKPDGTLLHTSQFMAQAAQGDLVCPIQSNPAYIASGDVSEGLFKILMRFASELKSSPANFDANLAIDSRFMRGRMHDFEELRAGILTTNPRSELKLNGIALAKPLLPESFGYELIYQSLNSQSRWLLMVDFTPDGLKVLNFDEIR